MVKNRKGLYSKGGSTRYTWWELPSQNVNLWDLKVRASGCSINLRQEEQTGTPQTLPLPACKLLFIIDNWGEWFTATEAAARASTTNKYLLSARASHLPSSSSLNPQQYRISYFDPTSALQKGPLFYYFICFQHQQLRLLNSPSVSLLFADLKQSTGAHTTQTSF